MAKRRRTADEIVREVQLAARQQVIDRVDDRGMAEVVEAWAPHFEQLRDRLLNSRPHEIHEVIDATMRELARATVRPAQRSIRQGAIIGMQASDREHEALTGPGGPIRSTVRQAASVPSAVSRERAREIAQERIRGTTSHGGVRLSTRLHRQAREVSEHATSIVRSSIEARVGMHEAAEEFLGVARTQMQLAQPRYLDRIVAEARRARDTGDRTRLLEVIEGHRGQLNRRGQGRDRRDGEYSLRSTVRQFVRDVQMRPEDVDALLARHMEDRAQFVARRIMRHETAEAMRTAHLEGLAGKPYVKGIRWTLSPAHPRPDVCDLYAMQALHGLGPGGYPLESVPETPHPLCLCSHESILDEEHFTRQGARRRGEPEPPRPWEDPTHQTAHDWLAEQPEAFRRQVLGPTRASIFNRSVEDRNRVIDGRGMPIPVGEVRAGLTRPAPTYSALRAPARLDPFENLSGRHVGAELTTRGRDVVNAFADASDGWETRTRETMRSAITETYPGIRLREPPARADRRGSILVEPSFDQGRSGDHDFTSREIAIDPEILRQARVGARAVANGRRMTERQARGTLVVLHEEMHGTSPMSPLAYDGPGRAIEEMTNEGLTRTMATRLGILTESEALRIGSYPAAMAQTLTWMGEHVPGMAEASASERLARLVEAGHRIRRRAAVVRRGEYETVFLDALDVPANARETALDGLHTIARLVEGPSVP